MQCVHVDRVAAPGKYFAGGSEFEACDIGDRSGRSMIARNPLRIHKRERARLDRNCKRCANKAAGSVGQVGANGHVLSGGEWRRQENDKQCDHAGT